MSKRCALIVAADDYSDSSFGQLRAPAYDAEELEKVLGDPLIGDFDVTRMLNKTAAEAKTEIERFFLHREPEDILMLYFSCHGFKDEAGLLYFAMPKTQTGLLDSTAVEASFVNKQMEKSTSRQIVLILDCCYSGAFARGFATRSAETVTAGTRETFSGRGRVVITSSDALQYAFEDGELKSGKPELAIFTEAVVRGLRSGEADLDGDGWISTGDLYRFTEKEVLSVSPSQHPTILSMLQGDIHVAKSVKRQRAPMAAQPATKVITTDQPGPEGGEGSGSEPVGSAQSHYDRGLRFARERDRLAASSEFEKVAAVGRSKLADLATFNLGALAAAAGDLETAISHYSAAARSSNQVVAARATLNLACLRLTAGQADEASAALEEAMSYHDAGVEPRAAFLLGKLREQQGDLSEAWLLYGIAADHDGHPFSSEARSRYLELTGAVGEKAAVTRMLSVARYPKPAANALLACGKYYTLVGDLGKAREYYTELASAGDAEFDETADAALTEIAKAARARRYRFWKRH